MLIWSRRQDSPKFRFVKKNYILWKIANPALIWGIFRYKKGVHNHSYAVNICFFFLISIKPWNFFSCIYQLLPCALYTYEYRALQSIGWFIEDQAFSSSSDLSPPPPLTTLSRQKAQQATHRKTDKDRQLANERGRGSGEEPNRMTSRTPGAL
jgi:hypothetical protein